ncbi:MAG: glycosyltransferase family 4 protein [Candidatus Sedimenticola sp. (ex Thyasira tokunagai)]
MQKKRLLLLTSTFPRWQGDHEPPFVYELARRLTDNWEVHVLSPHTAGLPTREQLSGITVHRFRYAPAAWENLAYQGGMLARLRQNPLRYLLLPLFLLGAYINARSITKKQNIDLIHAHWLLPMGFVAALLKYTKAYKGPVICTSHGGDLFALRGKVTTLLKRFSIRMCDQITIVSNAMIEPIIALGADKDSIQIIPMGTDLDTLFTPPETSPDPDKLIFAGRLVKKKGVDTLLQAFKLVLQEKAQMQLHIAGDGPERAALETQATELKISHNTHFLGGITQERLATLFKEAACAVFPFTIADDGDQEGFGLVIVEAMGCGCAVIASPTPATRDILKDDHNSLLVDQKNPEQLSSAILHLRNNEKLRQKLANAGSIEVREHFCWYAITDSYNSLLRSLVYPHPNAGS